MQGVVFGWLDKPQARRTQLARALVCRQVQITASGLYQRFGPPAAQFLQAVFRQMSAHVPGDQPGEAQVLQRVPGVIVEDSITISLPDELAGVRWGCAGKQTHTAAGIKLHRRQDLEWAMLCGPERSAVRLSDQRSCLHQHPLPAGTLHIADDGYFRPAGLSEHATGAGRFLSCITCPMACFDEAGVRLDLVTIGPQAVRQVLDRPVVVGTQAHLPVRVLMIRVAEQRREQSRQTARTHHCPPTREYLDLAAWTILITNLPSDLLACREAASWPAR